MNDKIKITIEIPNTGLEEDILRKGEWEDDSLFGRSLRNALMHFTKDSFCLNYELDKIRAEITTRDRNVKAMRSDGCCFFTAEEVLEIIDKYNGESAPQQKIGHCKDCKWWKDKDGVYRRGIGAESKCPINRREVMEGMGYCYMFELQEREDNSNDV